VFAEAVAFAGVVAFTCVVGTVCVVVVAGVGVVVEDDVVAGVALVVAVVVLVPEVEPVVLPVDPDVLVVAEDELLGVIVEVFVVAFFATVALACADEDEVVKLFWSIYTPPRMRTMARTATMRLIRFEFLSVIKEISYTLTCKDFLQLWQG
jgi:hypothetical protein